MTDFIISYISIGYIFNKIKKLTKINSGSVIRIDLRLITPKANAHTRKDGNVLFNDALNTFYLRLHGVGHMVKDHSDSE